MSNPAKNNNKMQKPEKSHSADESNVVITGLFSGTAYDVKWPGELISETGNGLSRKQRKNVFMFNGPGCVNNDNMPAFVAWDPEPEVDAGKRLFNLIRRLVDIAMGRSLKRIVDAAVQQISARIEKLRSQNKSVVVNLGGWSRGAVASALVANKLAAAFPDITINLSLVDPVAGPRNEHQNSIKIEPQIKNVLVFYAQNEKRSFMSPCNLELKSQTTKVSVIRMPGNHFSAVEPSFSDLNFNAQNEPKVVWRLFIDFFKKHGTNVNEKRVRFFQRLNLSELGSASFKEVRLNDWQLMDDLVDFKRNGIRGKVLNQEQKFCSDLQHPFFNNEKQQELMQQLCPMLADSLDSDQFTIKNASQIYRELTNLKENHCWNLLETLRSYENNKHLKVILSDFLSKNIIRTKQDIDNEYKAQLVKMNSNLRTDSLLPHAINRNICISLHRVWTQSKLGDWRDGFRKLAENYCSKGFFTRRHHRDIFEKLIKFLDTNPSVSTKDVLDQAMTLLEKKDLAKLNKEGLFIQSLSYFRHLTAAKKSEENENLVQPQAR